VNSPRSYPRKTIRVLQEQLEAEREAHWEARRIIAGLVQRILDVEAATPERPPERLETGPTQHEPAEPANPERSEPDREDLRRAQPERVEPERSFAEEPSEPRSWWRRTFGV
jgi:hypothetical protein